MVGCSSSHLPLNTESYVLVTDNMAGFVKLLSFFTSAFSFHTKIPELNRNFSYLRDSWFSQQG